MPNSATKKGLWTYSTAILLTMEDSMRKMLMALSAVAVIGAGTVATPTSSHAMAPLAIAAIVVGGVIATVLVVDAVHHHAYADENWRHHRRHHRHRHHR